LLTDVMPAAVGTCLSKKLYIRCRSASVRGTAVAIGKGNHHRNLMRGIGGIDQIQKERIALTTLIAVWIVINRRVVKIIGNVALETIALHEDVRPR
jgi:hypothetical protein